MQVSALNLIIAAQQSRAAAPTRPAPSAAEVRKAPEQTSENAGFAPLDFKSTTDTASTSASSPSRSTPLGSQVDIRV